MTGAIFMDWLKKLDQIFKRRERKILLILDNCPAHQIPEGLQNIEIRFLPALTISALQPCDMGIIKALKDQYRKRMITYLLTCMEEKKMLNWLEAAWVGVSSSTIKNCFSHSGFVMDEAMEEVVEEEMNRCFEALKKHQAIDVNYIDFLEVDKDVQVAGEQSIEEIVKEVMGKEEDEEVLGQNGWGEAVVLLRGWGDLTGGTGREGAEEEVGSRIHHLLGPESPLLAVKQEPVEQVQGRLTHPGDQTAKWTGFKVGEGDLVVVREVGQALHQLLSLTFQQHDFLWGISHPTKSAESQLPSSTADAISISPATEKTAGQLPKINKLSKSWANFIDQVNHLPMEEDHTSFTKVEPRRKRPVDSETTGRKSRGAVSRHWLRSQPCAANALSPSQEYTMTLQKQVAFGARSVTVKVDQYVYLECCPDFSQSKYFLALEAKLGKGSVYQWTKMEGHILPPLLFSRLPEFEQRKSFSSVSHHLIQQELQRESLKAYFTEEHFSFEGVGGMRSAVLGCPIHAQWDLGLGIELANSSEQLHGFGEKCRPHQPYVDGHYHPLEESFLLFPMLEASHMLPRFRPDTSVQSGFFAENLTVDLIDYSTYPKKEPVLYDVPCSHLVTVLIAWKVETSLAKVSNLQDVVGTKEEVGRLQVAVDDAAGMAVGQATHYDPLEQIWVIADRVQHLNSNLMRCCFWSQVSNFGTNFAATRLMPKSLIKIEWHEPIDMFRSSATSLMCSGVRHALRRSHLLSLLRTFCTTDKRCFGPR
ncbi:TIGD6 [Cordylochernes scorpioides]|uniref:TIGD6 n=1 Tax=Cordylochernes scorpioides TaxID=51811 RepID=A0ABY6LRI9_9ARAC|nr:TIGD6 [Cordylochernes scorpioides]